MLGLNALANLFAHPPGVALLTTQQTSEMLLDATAESLGAVKAMERRTAAAVLVNLSIGLGHEMEETQYVQALCALFNSLGDESDKDTLMRVLIAIGWILYGNDGAVETVKNFGFEVIVTHEDADVQALASEVKRLLTSNCC